MNRRSETDWLSQWMPQLAGRAMVLFSALVAIDTSADPLYNLDFERAMTNGIVVNDPPDLGPAYGPIQKLLPGWQLERTALATLGAPADYKSSTNQVSYLAFSKHQFDVGAILTGRGTEIFSGVPQPGTFSLFLSSSDGTYIDSWYRLTQTGEVPADASVLQMFGLVAWTGGIRLLPPTMNGLPLRELASGEPWVSAWDVSSFAGQTVEFEFTVPPGYSARIDGFAFIPEPPPQWLWGAATAAVFLGAGFRRRGRPAR